MHFDEFAGSAASVSDEFSILLNANAGVARHTLDKRVIALVVKLYCACSSAPRYAA